MLESVDIDRWLSAMPASVVRPDSHAAVVEEMLADVPLPDGFDAEELIRADTVLDRYQLGAEVTGAVACGWVEQWLRARKTGDTVRAREAVEAMPSSRDWAILKELRPLGGWSSEVWKYADAMKTGKPIMGGKPLTVRESYAPALDCGADR